MTDSTHSRRDVLKLGGAALAATLAGCASGPSGGQQGTETEQATASPTEADTPSDDSAETDPFTELYDETIDSVVLVSREGGQGTGFVYDDSHVVTNAHVVGRASTAEIRFNDGTWRTGEVVGSDANSDLAVVAVEDIPADATPLPLSESDPEVGQQVAAIGNPFSLQGSFTTGVISGIDRSIPAPTGFRIPDAVQTDAAVNPGNSGGPLMSRDGRVVAVINSGGGDNIAFGISAALTRRVVPELIETGEYDHSYMGVGLNPVSPTVARANDLDEPQGVIVTSVVEDGPAAGTLRPSDLTVIDGQRVPVGGDVILAIDGTEIATSEDLGSYLALETRPGETVELTVLRDGERQTIAFELGTRPGPGGK